MWEHKLFDNSTAIFALSTDGLVQAIFDGKVPAGTKVIGLVLTRVGDQNAVSSIAAGSGNGGTTVAGSSTTLDKVSTTLGPINGVPLANTLVVPSSFAPLSSSMDETILTLSPETTSASAIAEPAATTESSNESSSTTSEDSVFSSLNTEIASSTIIGDRATSAIPTSAITSSPETSPPTSSSTADYTSTLSPLSSISTTAISPISSSPPSEVLSLISSSGAYLTSSLNPPSGLPATSSTPISSSTTSDTPASSTIADYASTSVPPSSIPTTPSSPVSLSLIAEAALPTSSSKATYTSTSPSTLSTPPTPSSSPQPSCTSLHPPSTLLTTLGHAILATSPHSNNTYTTLSTTFTLTFPLLNPGSKALSELNPATAPLDSILYYQLPLSLTTPTPTCLSWGYLYHQESGLCLTALPASTSTSNSNATSSPAFEGGGIVLEECKVCEALPQENQLFCAVQEDGSLGKWFCVGFMGDDAQGVGYGVLYETGAVDAVLEEGGGDCIYVASF